MHNSLVKISFLMLIIYNLSSIAIHQTDEYLIIDRSSTALNTHKTKVIQLLQLVKEKERIQEGKHWKRYYHILPNLINKYNLQVGCEIGVAFGGHSEAILKNTNIKKLYSIDSYIDADYMFNKAPKGFYEVLYQRVKLRLSKFKQRSTLLRNTSIDASKKFADKSLDFIFIDAGHEYQDVQSDLTSWYKKVRSGGIIAGDDYQKMFPGVIKAVDEFFGKHKITVYHDKQISKIWWAIKP